MTAPRRTEEVASKTVTETLGEIIRLTDGQPTTVELEEAQRHVLALQRALQEWVSARHLVETANRRQIPVETESEREELDRIEAAHPTVPAPPFDVLTAPFRRPA